MPPKKSMIQEIVGVSFFLSSQLHLHPSQQSLHSISICHRKTSNNQNLWLPDRKHSFPVVVAKDTVFTENGGWDGRTEQLLMGGFITFHLHVAASSASTPSQNALLLSPCFLSYCCMNPIPCPLLSLPFSNSVSVKKTAPSPSLLSFSFSPSVPLSFSSLSPSLQASQFSFLSSLTHSKITASLGLPSSVLQKYWPSFPVLRWTWWCWISAWTLTKLQNYLHDTLSGYSIVITVHWN